MLYLHNLLCEDALRFYLDAARPVALNITQAVGLVDGEYNSPVRDARVRNQLRSLRVSSLVSEGMCISPALGAAYESIMKHF